MRTVQEIITEIGTWADPVKELKDRGIKGQRDDCELCPMARYIARNMDDTVQWIRVEPQATIVHPRNGDNYTVENPPNMSNFITDFDQGEIPELDEHPEDEDDWFSWDEEEDDWDWDEENDDDSEDD